jgi:protease I
MGGIATLTTMSDDTLAGKCIAVLAADGVEHAEVQEPAMALKAAGAQVALLAPHPGRIRSMQVHQPGELLRVDKTIDAASAADYDGLLVPGGHVSPDTLRQSALARELVRQMHGRGKPLAFLSQAPLLLVSCGLAPQRVLTCWPGIRDDLVNAGAIWLNRPIMRDGQYLFGRGVQDLAIFVAALPGFFAGAAEPVPTPAPTHSDPPPETPSELPDQPLRWLSAPSVRAMLSLALLGVGVVAVNQGRHKRRARAAEDAQAHDATPGVADATADAARPP